MVSALFENEVLKMINWSAQEELKKNHFETSEKEIFFF